MDEAQNVSTEQASDSGTGEKRQNWQLTVKRPESDAGYETVVVLVNATELEATERAAIWSYAHREFAGLELYEGAVIVFDNDGYRLGQ
jgi:hypothetical protein